MKTKRVYFGIIGLLAIIWLVGPISISADEITEQSSSSNWSSPVNISQSGGASDPLVVMDSLGVMHVIWQDIFDGLVYSRSIDEGWSPPIPTTFPFDTYQPKLLPDHQGTIHVFWLDAEDGLNYSSNSSDNFGNENNWLQTQKIAEVALAFDVTIDQAGTIYLTYIRPIDAVGAPAGVYFRSSRDRGTSWSQAIRLQESRYFRNLSRDTASIHISQSVNEDVLNLYVVWDNPARGRIYFTRSVDGGQDWESPYEIDQTQVTTPLSGPFNVNVNSFENQVLIVWQVGQAGVSCTHYYQVSNDIGQTWSEKQRFLQELTAGGCPREFKMITGHGLLTHLYINVLEDVYLTVWDGSQWSLPRIQVILTNFLDPEVNTSVEFRCRDVITTSPVSISVVGCDIGSGKDIWYLERRLGDIQDWFQPPSAWTSPSPLFITDNQIAQAELVTDTVGNTHALWVIDNEIMYSRWEQGSWLEASVVIQRPNEAIDTLVAQVDSIKRLHIVWTTASGAVFHSWANAERASIRTEWATSENVIDTRPVDNSLGLEISKDGNIHIVYSVPINEYRGIYLVQSSDQGKTWSEPIQIFDAASQNWEMVTSPQIRETEEKLHVIWSQRQFSEMNQIGLYYSNSGDGGWTWSPYKTIVDNSITFTKLLVQGDRTLHLVRVEESDDRLVTSHVISFDNGLTWIRGTGLGTIGIPLGPTAVTIDPAGQLHLLQLIENIAGDIEIIEWLWTGINWRAGQSVVLDQSLGETLSSIAIAVSSNGQITGIYDTKNPVDDQPISYVIYSIHRLIDLPAVIPTPTLEIISPTPTPLTGDPTNGENESEELATQTVDVNQLLTQAYESTDQSFLVVGVLAVSLPTIVLITIALLVRRRNSK